MSEKPSRLLVNAKELINSNKLNDAVFICEEVIKLEPDNINALLLATKCWMDLDLKHENVKSSLEKVLLLKPNNATAIQGLRKFYDKHLNLYFDDAVNFFKYLFKLNELSDKDLELITNRMVKKLVSTENEKFFCDCLVFRIKTENHISCLKIFFQIAAENFMIAGDRNYFDQFINLIANFEQEIMSTDENEIVYLKTMETLFRAHFDGMEPEFFFTLMEKNQDSKNIYGYYLFADILCKHYLFSDCRDSLEFAFEKLEIDEIMKKDGIYKVLKTLQVTNLIQWFKCDELKSVWPENSIEFLPKYLWCHAFAVGFDPFAAIGSHWENFADIWFQDMSDVESVICKSLMGIQSSRTVEDDWKVLRSANLTSFQWYLWSTILKNVGSIDGELEALAKGSDCRPVYYKIHEILGKIYALKNDYKTAVLHLMTASEKYYCLEIVETLINLHIEYENYKEPIGILENLEIESCPESLLNKFVLCLNRLERVTDAISLAQRIVKYYPTNGINWQLLGDLYLKRGNINSAFTMYSKSIESIGLNHDTYARMGNVFSLKYQESLDENDFHESIANFSKSLELKPSAEAIEGKAFVLYLHAEMSLKQLMLSSTVNDVQNILQLLIEYNDQLSDSTFQMNLLGKAVFLSIVGSIDNLIDLNCASHFLAIDRNNFNSYNIAFSCFKKSIIKFPTMSESHFNFALLALYKLNIECSQRGNIASPGLFNEAEIHFKEALFLDPNHHDAWKYLGFLYLRHGVVTSRLVFDVQHCLSMAINLTSTANSVKDVESTYLLALLYIKENWYHLAKEIFTKMQMDHPVSPIGYLGMYLVAAYDHTVSEQSFISKAILCFNYTDEESSLDEYRYRISDSIVGLFCDNLGFLINSQCDYETFNSPESRSNLVTALKCTLNNLWVKYEVHRSVGSLISDKRQKQYREYGCFLGILELLTGNRLWGKRLIERSTNGNEDGFSIKISDFLKFENSWTNVEHCQCVEDIANLCKHTNISLTLDGSPQSIDGILVSSLTQYLSSPQTSLATHLDSLIGNLSASFEKSNYTSDMQISYLMSLGTLIISIGDQSLATKFIKSTDEYHRDLVNDCDNFPRTFCRLKSLALGARDAFRYLYDHCLKQPFHMNRWLNLLEFGLEYLDDLVGFVDISQIFLLVNRPWCFSSFEVERYARILRQYSLRLTTACVTHHKHMIMQSMRLYPNLCFKFFKIFFFV